MSESMEFHLPYRENDTLQTSLSDIPKVKNQINGFEHGIHHSLPNRAPLRCIQDNPNLLRSPGPLESMLKTTTETGDIGVFTIKPTIAPATYHQPPRPRPGLADANLLQASRSQYYREILNRDDRKRLPSSYRDTTSEILSLYGSDAPQSRAFTPSDDDGRRSYSLTTCSSRYMPSQKSSITLQSHSSGPGLQRSRSPFPYPTRLRRPGVRAASPALTENGAIDYSKMVQLDRPTQRTVHGSYKPNYRHAPRRGLLPPLRADGNRSTASLPSSDSPGVHLMNSPTFSARAPVDGRFGVPRTLERPWEASNPQSLRSSSLTSIIEMYHRTPTAHCPAAPEQPTSSFYYDYSEEFEENGAPFPLPHTTVPLCPIPQRAVSLSRPMVLRAEEDGDIEIQAANMVSSERIYVQPALYANMEPSRPYTQSYPQADEASDGQSQRLEYKPCSDGENHPFSRPDSDNRGETKQSELIDTGTKKVVETTSSLNEREPNQAYDMDHQTRKEVLGTENHVFNVIPLSSSNSSLPLGCPSPQKPDKVLKRTRRSKTLSPEEVPRLLQSEPTFEVSTKKTRYILNSVPSDSAPLFGSFNQSSRSPLPVNQEKGVEAKEQLRGACTHEIAGEFEKEMTDMEQLSSNVLKSRDDGQNNFRKRHRRNHAATVISAFSSIGANELPTEQMASTATEIFQSSPPNNPKYTTEASYSVPLLMKALPPSPAAELTESTPEHPINEPSELPNEGNISSKATRDEDHEHNETSDFKATGSLPRFRVRLKQSATLNTSSESESMSASEPERTPSLEEPVYPFQRKLKIKIAKAPRALRAHAGLDGTVLRSPALKQCNSLADLERCIRRDMFTSRSQLENAFSEGTTENSKALASTSKSRVGEPWSGKSSESPHCHIDVQTPANSTTNKVNLALATQTSSKPGILRHARSLGSDVGHSNNQGLRQKLSFLRLRIGGTQQDRDLREDNAIMPSRIQEDSRENTVSSGGVLPSQESDACEKQLAHPPRSTKRLFKMWTRGARKAVRSYVRRTLDRSTGSSTVPTS